MQGGGPGAGINFSLNSLDAKFWQGNPFSPANDVVGLTGFTSHHIS
jgi:hypothetical protein